jgi:hypothetical protein
MATATQKAAARKNIKKAAKAAQTEEDGRPSSQEDPDGARQGGREGRATETRNASRPVTRMDEDLPDMSRERLIEEVRRLRRGIRSHRGSTGHELWHHQAPRAPRPSWPYDRAP